MKPVSQTRAMVTGMGALCSLGLTLDTCMDHLFEGAPSPKPPERFSTNHTEPYPVFGLPGPLDPRGGKAEDLSLTARMAVAAAREAIDNAGLSPKNLKGRTVGVCMGTTVGAALNNDPFYIQYRNGEQPGMAPIKRFLRSNPAQAVARALDLTGPVQTIVNACASGADAVGTAAGWVRAGVCDLAIAGGADELCKVTYNGFISLMITDPRPCRPFDAGRRGLNLGEGAAAMIIEPAGRSDARHLARIAGYGSAGDAYHLTAPRPDASGLRTALEKALAEAGKTVSDIGFINAHGTGTRDNDRMEMTLFKDTLPGVPFFSTKGYTGHTLGAAGAIEAVFTIACMNRGIIPASAGFSTPDPDFGISPVIAPLAVSADSAISQSVAFGGNNAVLVFSKG